MNINKSKMHLKLKNIVQYNIFTNTKQFYIWLILFYDYSCNGFELYGVFVYYITNSTKKKSLLVLPRKHTYIWKAFIS